MARIRESSNPTAIELRQVSYTYPDALRPSLSAISCRIRRAEFVAIVGPTGCGKSSLGLVMARLIPQKLGGDFSGTARIAGSIGILFQNPESQLFSLTVANEIAFGPRNLGCPAAEIERRLKEVSQQTGVEALLPGSPNAISTGQQQRVAIASVLSLQPDILILDEPTAHLDPAGKEEIMELLERLNRRGTTIILFEHNLPLISRYARRIMVMADGKITADGDRGVLTKYHPGLPRMALPSVSGGRESPAVELKSLSFAYPKGNRVLKEIDLTIHEGEFAAILGDNGSGKTTLARHLNALLKPSGGRVNILGGAATPQKVGYAFQNPDYQLFEQTVADEIAFGPANLGLARQEIEKRVSRAIEAVGLEEYRQADPHTLSAGQKRCVAIASVLAMNPPIIVLDEPSAGLDMQKAAQLMQIAAHLNRRGHTVIVLSHDIQLVSAFCTRAVVLQDGSIQYDGSMTAWHN
jgi:energy-coupling factor transporter ATP-binding protein EcfA2